MNIFISFCPFLNRRNVSQQVGIIITITHTQMCIWWFCVCGATFSLQHLQLVRERRSAKCCGSGNDAMLTTNRIRMVRGDATEEARSGTEETMQELLEPTGWAQPSGLGSHGPGFLPTFNAKCTWRQVTAILTFTNNPLEEVVCISWKKPTVCYSARAAITKHQREWLNPQTFISLTFGGWTSKIKVPRR